MARSGEIELMRILAAVMVLNVHTVFYKGCGCLMPGGNIGVEFFFLLSGYLMAAHLQKKTQPVQTAAELCTETYRYLWRRLASFWPELLAACCIGLAVFSWGHHFAVRPTLNMAHDTLMGNVLLLHMTALAPRGVDGPIWYLSALLLASAVLYPLFRRLGHSPVWLVVSLMLLGYLLTTDEKAATWGFAGPRQWMGWTYKGNLRALAELALGASLHLFVQMLLRQRVSQVLSLVLTVLKWGCYGVAFLYCLHPSGRYAPITLVALACALVLCFSRLCIDRDWYQYGWIMWLGRFSLPLYLSHVFWAENLAAILPCLTERGEKLLAYHLAAVVTALLVMFLAKQLRCFTKRMRENNA